MGINTNSTKKRLSWHNIDWTHVYQKVRKQQVKIGVAYNNKNFGLVTQ